MARIACVDDVEDMLRLYRDVLAHAGHDGALYSSGQDFLRALDAGETYDLVVLDLAMREMTGIAVIDEMRKEGRKTKICVVSAFASPEMEERLMARGVVACLKKPFENDELIGAVNRGIGAEYSDTAGDEPPPEDDLPPGYGKPEEATS